MVRAESDGASGVDHGVVVSAEILGEDQREVDERLGVVRVELDRAGEVRVRAVGVAAGEVHAAGVVVHGGGGVGG